MKRDEAKRRLFERACDTLERLGGVRESAFKLEEDEIGISYVPGNLFRLSVKVLPPDSRR